MRPQSVKAITPVWGQQIEVEHQGDTLLVTGWGFIPYSLSVQRVPPKERSRLNILQRLRRYALRHLDQSRGDSGIYQFADATDDQRLIAFVKEFGPVNGEVIDFAAATNGTWTVTVKETLKSLRREQRRFALLVQMVQQVNLNARADFGVLDHLLDELGVDADKLRGWFTAIEDLVSQGLITSKSADLLPMAHQTLCLYLNDYAPKLVYVGDADEVVQLPEVREEGIHHALYYQLRLDYLAKRRIGICAQCGNHFPVIRLGAQACSETCRKALRNAQYWDRNKIALSEGRREARKTANDSRRGAANVSTRKTNGVKLKPRTVRAAGGRTSLLTSTTRKGK